MPNDSIWTETNRFPRYVTHIAHGTASISLALVLHLWLGLSLFESGLIVSGVGVLIETIQTLSGKHTWKTGLLDVVTDQAQWPVIVGPLFAAPLLGLLFVVYVLVFKWSIK